MAGGIGKYFGVDNVDGSVIGRVQEEPARIARFVEQATSS
jgi:hypothetical protein